MKKILFILLLVVFLPTVVNAKWVPSPNPDPSQILDEARDDACEHRYEDALAKHVWYHKNALKYRPSHYGVRLSFALSYWYSLGKSYHPALEKMKSIRDETEENIKSGGNPCLLFDDFRSINGVLGERGRTVSLFKWLDKNKSNVARDVFRFARPTLVREKEYILCGKYIDAEVDYHQFVDSFKSYKKMAENPEMDESLGDFAVNSFLNDVSTLVALLVVNNQEKEAREIVSSAKKELDDPMFYETLEKASRGIFPAPWP